MKANWKKLKIVSVLLAVGSALIYLIKQAHIIIVVAVLMVAMLSMGSVVIEKKQAKMADDPFTPVDETLDITEQPQL